VPGSHGLADSILLYQVLLEGRPIFIMELNPPGDSVGPPLAITHRLRLSPVEVTGYSHMARCPLAVRSSRATFAGPMGRFNDSDQFTRDYVASRTHFQH